MTESPNLQNIVPLEACIPAAPLESILCTDELLKRPGRPPDHARENSALAALTGALADSPATILQTLADKVLEVLGADSAGLSLLTKDGKRFYWAAIAGAWQPHLGGGTPRDFGPCGDVLDRNITMLFTHWERRDPYLSAAMPLAEEGLLVPFYVNGKSVGTIWAIAHRNHRKFDSEDQRLLESMGRFASAAYQTFKSIEELNSEIAAREKAQARLVSSNAALERERDNKLLKAQAITAAIAHEIRQPLASVAINADTAMRYLGHTPPDHDKIRTVLNRIRRDVDRAGGVFDSMRALFGKHAQERQPIDVNRIILDVIESLQGELNDHVVVTRRELMTELPLVNGHQAQLQEVVFNVINNAVEAMSATTNRSRALWVRTEVCGSDQIAVSVQDSGPGIDPSQLENVFNAFVSTKAHGIGLGLAICRMIVEGHGGQLTASSDGESGTLFQLTLPIGSLAGVAID